MDAKYVNEACMAACDECPQHRGFDDDTRELGGGTYTNVSKLHRKGILAVVKYWRDPQTIGGQLLWEFGYSDCLDPTILELFENVDQIINKAITEALAV